MKPLVICTTVMLAFSSGVQVAAQSPSSTPLRIVVVEGEDAVNIVQQKTAVAPVVEIRDRNDQPVAGAIVRFTVTKGRATFSGARTLTVATNAAGRAAVTGFTPTGAGALQVTASATFQGQTIAATIAQTNVMTAAEAATVSAAGSSGAGGAGGAAGAGGGGAGSGLSATTVGIVGGAAAGGAIAAKEVLGGGPSQSPTTYSGKVSGPLTEVWAGSGCTITDATDGTINMTLDVASDGTIKNGEADVKITIRRVTLGPVGCQNFTLDSGGGFNDTPAVHGTASSLTFSGQYSNPVPPSATFTQVLSFTGVLTEGQINGTVSITLKTAAGPAVLGTGSADYSVVLK